MFGTTAFLPFALWGFVITGTFIGVVTAGWLAIPGALLGIGAVMVFGALVGRTVARLILVLARNLRQRGKTTTES